MVTTIIEMPAEQATLRLQVSESGWTQVELEQGEHRYDLGAEWHRLVIQRLRRGLAKDAKRTASWKIANVPVWSVLSLAELHTSIFAGKRGPEWILFFQGASGELITSVVLTESERQAWLATLGVS